MVTKAARTDAILGRLVDEQLRARGLEFDDGNLPEHRKTLYERQQRLSTGPTPDHGGVVANGGAGRLTSIDAPGNGDTEFNHGGDDDFDEQRWEGTSWAVPIDKPLKARITQAAAKLLPTQRSELSRSTRFTVGFLVVILLAVSWFILHGQSSTHGLDDDSAIIANTIPEQVTVQTIGVLDVELQSTANSADDADIATLDQPSETAPQDDEPAEDVAASAPLQQGPTTMFVHIAGGVAAPGVVELSAGSRVVDAVRAAGGLLPSADADRVNLAAPLHDGLRIVVPLIGHDVPVEVPLMQPGGNSSGSSSGNGASSASASTAQTSNGGPININTASVTDLDTLPGVGPATASIIVSHRDQHGAFPSVDSLMEVRGIGQAKLDSIRDLVTV